MGYEGCQLIPKSSSCLVHRYPSTLMVTPLVAKVKRFGIDGQLPILPQRKNGQDAGFDILSHV